MLAIAILIILIVGAYFLQLNTCTKYRDEYNSQKNYQPSDFPKKIELGKKYYLSFLIIPGQRHRGFELCEVVGFEEYDGDPEYYPIIKEQSGKTYATCRMRLRSLTTDTTIIQSRLDVL